MKGPETKSTKPCPRVADAHCRPPIARDWSNMRFRSHLFLPWLNELLFCPKKNGALVRAAGAALCSEDLVVWSTDWVVKDGQRSSDMRYSYMYIDPSKDLVVQVKEVCELGNLSGYRLIGIFLLLLTDLSYFPFIRTQL